jgi:hypothetical protein
MDVQALSSVMIIDFDTQMITEIVPAPFLRIDTARPFQSHTGKDIPRTFAGAVPLWVGGWADGAHHR